MTSTNPSTPEFHVFAFDDYYPDGGVSDYVGTAESIEEARALGRETGKVIVQVATAGLVLVEEFRTR